MRLAKRQEDESPSSIIRPGPEDLQPTATDATPGTGTATSTESLVLATSTEGPSSLPLPFDTSLGSNFTSPSCPTFFKTFLSDPTFQSCLPFSLLLQNSQGFFQASKSAFRITSILDATCNVDVNACASYMGQLGSQIRKTESCGADFNRENPLVLQAYRGLVSYQPLYQAGCLRDSSGNYCYANAITNASSSTDSYPYYLPLGMTMPGGARPTCNTCLESIMAIFANAAQNGTQPVSQTYASAAKQINLGCGPDFVNTTVTVRTSAASTPSPLGGIYQVLAFFMLMAYFF
ncbi:hypothetical protein P152DRAFT_391388 [Eremomyces bilateralis CBS 781.70]|uniref:DUF7729 domain-containing protein n=1 Tax=Eremomyces bilateralis CBS 781.70 TaxID=1392243 RepID=A0A6G1GAH6_9PEZI|nr:uncharacterized protein P152DRAFT_391388 [Eremomyces bilateralis CBS 781.70]KAF1814910.1 hypothetical protein P152DRAFT_391388 [Eremomyces bilateralis CBS 781.70]